MFEAAEIGAKLSKAEYAELVPQLRVDMLNLQYDLRSADFSLVVLIEGDDRRACRRALAGLHDWMDARYVRTQVFGPPSDEERGHPLMWRYWRRLPRKGLTAAMYDAWAVDAIRARVLGELDDAGFARRVQHMRRFEEQLVDNGTLLVKLWFHLSRARLKKRVAKARKKPEQAWRLGGDIERLYERYDEAMAHAETLLSGTSTGSAPWTIIESADKRHADATAARTLFDALGRRLEAPAPAAPASPPPTPDAPPAVSVLDTVDLSASLDEESYAKKLRKLQDDVAGLSLRAHEQGVSSVLVFEGWDAAGKGGSIRKLSAAVDPRLLRIIPIAAPTEEERAHHYLWRFWQHVPRSGEITIFDRSWYGRVLVERVEGFAPENAWRRAYGEIRDFEDQLREAGTVLCKYWLHIDEDEQLARFEARKQTPYKKYKLTDEDYRNRARRPAYTLAVDEMVARTSTSDAPWTLVAGNDKRHARVQVLQTWRDALATKLDA